jgi:competence protein ComEA
MRAALAALAALLALPLLAQAPAQAQAPRPAATPAPARSAPAATQAASKVDINSATEAQIESLPGIGPVRGKAIVAGRPYAELQDLVKKKVLTQAVFDHARGQMALANINTSTAEQMEKTLPGVGAVRSKAIVAARPYANPHELVTKNVLSEGVYNGMKDLIAW